MMRLLACSLAIGLAVTASAAGEPMKYRDQMRDVRYGEIIVVTGGPLSYVGHVYNTIGLNDCPEAAWRALNVKALKKQFQAKAVVLNGPRYFMMDRISIARPGKTETFGGLQARLLADVDIGLSNLLRGRAKPYTENTVQRTTEYLYRKGRPIFELVAPDGTTYVMQTYAQIVDPDLAAADLPELGEKLKLPKGWKFRARVPKEDYSVRADGTAHVLQDNLQNTYQRVN